MVGSLRGVIGKNEEESESFVYLTEDTVTGSDPLARFSAAMSGAATQEGSRKRSLRDKDPGKNRL